MALLTVVDTGTFSAAAIELGYTQSAVSQQIGTLERMVGTPLFERPGGRRPVRLTAAGEMLLTHARAVLARV
ncbi:MAG: LysR family transcriptional regulator, partial [Actinomycetes bacterium]